MQEREDSQLENIVIGGNSDFISRDWPEQTATLSPRE
jgi:hypothetical protein